jgi:hypothetical protein
MVSSLCSLSYWLSQRDVDKSIMNDAYRKRMSYNYEGGITCIQLGNEGTGGYSWIYHALSMNLRMKHSR